MIKVIYVAGSYRASTVWDVDRNIVAARELGAEVMRLGAIPLIPHSNTSHMDGIVDDEFILEGTMELCRRCDALITVKGWKTSGGSRLEVEEMVRLGKPVFETVSALRDWLRQG